MEKFSTEDFPAADYVKIFILKKNGGAFSLGFINRLKPNTKSAKNVFTEVHCRFFDLVNSLVAIAHFYS